VTRNLDVDHAFHGVDVTWMEHICSDEILDAAFDWVCERRRDYSANNDVWDLRMRWTEIKPQLQADLLAGRFRLGAVERFGGDGDEEQREVWSAIDALVLKAVTIVLTETLGPELSERCFHLAGRGGAKAAVREVCRKVKQFPFVFRTDVSGHSWTTG